MTAILNKKTLVEEYHYYKDKPKATARAYLRRLIMDSLSPMERKIFDAVLEKHDRGYEIFSADVTRMTGIKINIAGVILKRLVDYGILTREWYKGKYYYMIREDC